MSQTFALVCKEAKLKIWVGQGWHAMTTFYSGMPEVMGRLGRFLEATRGKPLALMCDDTQGSQFEDCAEFEDPDAEGSNAYRLNRVTDPKEKNPMNKPTDDSGNATIADSPRNSELKEPLGTIKKTVRVTIEKEIEIEIMPSMFGHMSEKDFLDEFNKYLWKIDGMDDVIKYAATAAATGGCGYTHDGIGLVDSYFSTYPRVPDVKIKEVYEDIEAEIIDRT